MLIRPSFTGTRNHVWSEDPAIDRDSPAFDWVEFLRTGDLAHVPTVEGGKLTVFKIRPLSRKQFTRVFNLNGLEQLVEAVAYGLREVKDFILDGQAVELKHIKVDGEERVSNDSLDRVFEPLLFTELGTRIVELSRLDPRKG